jgi:hypothetical protein
MRASVRKGNSVGLVTTTGGNDLVHTLGVGLNMVARTAIIRKILAYNNTGGNVTLQFGTLDAAAMPAFVQYLPDLLALNGLENIWNEVDLPATEFSVDPQALALGRAGNIFVLASAALVLITIEVEEFGS